MDRTTLQGQLVLIDRSIAETKADAGRMRVRVAELRRSGRDTRFAVERLVSFLVAHSVLEARREIILIQMEDIQWAS